MSLIESRLVDAIKSQRNFKSSNTSLRWDNNRFGVHGTIRLHNNLIVRIYHDCICLSDCGFQTKTTKSRLNAIIRGLSLSHGIYQKKYQWHLSINGKDTLWRGTEIIPFCFDDFIKNRFQNIFCHDFLTRIELNGYSDPFLNEGIIWIFPFNGVMAIPCPKSLMQ